MRCQKLILAFMAPLWTLACQTTAPTVDSTSTFPTYQWDFNQLNHTAQLVEALTNRPLNQPLENLTFAHHRLIASGQSETTRTPWYVLEHRGEKEKVVIVSATFRLNDLMEDSGETLRFDPTLNIHLNDAWRRIAFEIYNLAKVNVLDEDRLVFAGHGVGGAIALICAMYAANDERHIDQVVTFGQPKVTDKPGAAAYNFLPLVRVINQEDIIPLLPRLEPAHLSINGQYWHFGKEIVLFSGAYYALLTGQEQMVRELTVFNKTVQIPNLNAHKVELYKSSLSEKSHKHLAIQYSDRDQYAEIEAPLK